MVNPHILDVRVELIKRSAAPTTTSRLWLNLGQEDGPRSVVAKRIEPDWPDDPGGHAREARYYTRLSPHLEMARPHVYFAGLEPGSEAHLVIMEDLAGAFHFPPSSHRWSQAEIEPILRAYARLHAGSQDHLAAEEDRGWMVARHEQRLLETAARLPGMVEWLATAGIWPKIPGFGRLLERTLRDAARFADLPPSLLHNDVTPSNCGLPCDGPGEAVLLDWEMVGWGLAEMDLGYMFLQPFGNHRGLARRAALDYYWRQRQKLGQGRRSKTELETFQAYADALWALWLIPVAYRMANSPFPAGTPPRVYWDAMHGVLSERLGALCRAV